MERGGPRRIWKGKGRLPFSKTCLMERGGPRRIWKGKGRLPFSKTCLMERGGPRRIWKGTGMLAALTVLLTGIVAPAAEPQLPEGDYDAPAKLETATFIGSKGSEFLADAVFLPDGNVLIVGTCQDPELTLFGVKAKVVGKDAEPYPVHSTWVPVGLTDAVEEKKPTLEDEGLDPLDGFGGDDDDDLELRRPEEVAAEKQRREEELKELAAIPKTLKWTGVVRGTNAVYFKMTWQSRESTGFWGLFSSDLKTVHGLWRLPRGAGSVTAAERAPDGTIYIAGGADERMANATSNMKECETVAKGRLSKFSVPNVYVARLSADLSKIEWVRTTPNLGFGPKLRALRKENDIMLTSPDVRRFSPDGELKLASAISRSRYPDSVTVNPVTGGWSKGGDFLTMTGREPYRVPYFFIYEPDGTPYLELFRWHGAFAAVDALGHLVADAQVAKLIYDHDGNLSVTARSHGGNCVHFRYPWDMTKMMPNSLRGRMSSSPGNILKLSPDYKLLASTGIGDPGFFNALGYGIDGSVFMDLRCGAGVRPGALTKAPVRQRLIILSPTFTSRRFASPAPPGTGKYVNIAGSTRQESWGYATGWSKGKPKLLLLTGAVKEEKIEEEVYPAPQRNPVQEGFAGGRLDGYVLLFDLSPGPVKPAPEEPEKPEKKAAEKEQKVIKLDPPRFGADGQVYHVRADNIWWATSHMAFRDLSEKPLWPRFYDGKGRMGDRFVFSSSKDCEINVTIDAWYLQQADYNQDRRLFGPELGMVKRNDPRPKGVHKHQWNGRCCIPAVSFQITRMGPWKLIEKRRPSRRGLLVYQQACTTIDGVMRIGENEHTVQGLRMTGRFAVPRTLRDKPNARPNYVCMRFSFETTGAELGFKDPDTAGRPVRVQISCTGHASEDYGEFAEKEVTLPKLGDEAGGDEQDGDALIDDM